ncbi:MAG: hypothetical protein AAFV25_17415, partial [Bacteroidota bacterium]
SKKYQMVSAERSRKVKRPKENSALWVESIQVFSIFAPHFSKIEIFIHPKIFNHGERSSEFL